MSVIELFAHSESGEVAIYRDERGTWLQTLSGTEPVPMGPAEDLIKVHETFDTMEQMNGWLTEVMRSWLKEHT